MIGGTTTLYEKRGRRYVPVGQYDPAVMDGLPLGAHLICVTPGITSTRYHVEPDQASLLAALAQHREAISDGLRRISLPTVVPPERDNKTRMRHEAAWLAYKGIMGDDALMLTRPGVGGLLDELERLLIEAAKK
ncbi:MAG: hypothetical protein RL030_1756 [Pseudomonadota bacterium]|jgi:hypothetical protein